MSENKHLTPVWIAYVDGKRLDTEHEGALKRVTINHRLNGVSTFSMLFDSSAVKIRDKGAITLESEISIHLGYKDDVSEIFKGEVTGFRALLQEYGTETLEVTGCNALHRLNHGARYRNFEEKTPGAMIKEILDSYSLKAEVDDFGPSYPFFAQQGQTDLDFVLKMAGTYGKDVFAHGTSVYVADEITVNSDEVIFEWGKSLVSFEAEEDLTRLVSDATHIGWDGMKNESFSGPAKLADISLKIGGSNDWTKVSKGGGGKWMASTVDSSLVDADDAKAAALGFLQRNSFLFARARGTAEGNHKLLPGMRVTVKMAGEAFSGEYVADAVSHQFDYRNGYRTEFSLKRNMSP